MNSNKKVESKKKKKVMNKKNIRLIIAGIILILLIVLIVVLVISKEKDISKLEEIATKKYFEEGFIDVNELYMMSGESEIDEVQYIQAQTKRALDDYFENSGENTVDADVISGSINNPYDYTVDFNGILVSGYEYSPEDNTFTKVEGANIELENIEANTNMITENYSSQRISVEKIEKVEKDKYKVYADIVEGDNDETVAAKAEMTVRIEDEEIVLDTCNISE